MTPQAAELVRFAQMIAELGDDTWFEDNPEEAVATLERLIAKARVIVGLGS